MVCEPYINSSTKNLLYHCSSAAVQLCTEHQHVIYRAQGEVRTGLINSVGAFLENFSESRKNLVPLRFFWLGINMFW